MSRWLDRAEDLCYDGEDVTETVRVGEGGVVVTTHRVLVFSPTGDGSDFEHVDRPNVEGVRALTEGDRGYLYHAARASIAGVVLLFAGLFLPLDSLVGDVSFGAGASRIGLGGVIGLLEGILGLLQNLDDVLLALGALVLALGLGLLGAYMLSREDRLLVDVAGEEPLRLTLAEDADLPSDAIDRLERAIGPDGGA